MSKMLPSVGLSVLVDPEHASLDIVFVHGFTGHPERTWTHKNGNVNDSRDDNDAPPHKSRKLNPFSRPHQAVYWPKDLLPSSIPGARVLTFGYDTNIKHWASAPISRNTVYGIAGDFMVALEAERREYVSRPVIFVAHSLGGIVVKEMLRRASRGQDHFRRIFDATIGVMFFGTPHSGADPLGFSKRIIENLAKVLGWRVNNQIVDTLMPSSERLMELRDEFGPMAEDEMWIIYSFQEQLGIGALNGSKVVDDTSSYLNLPRIETRQHIEANHMDMCRFTGPSDMEYKKVVSALGRMIGEMATTANREPFTPDDEQRKILLDSLRFDQIHTRQMTIKKAYRQTCKWLLKTSEYIDWLKDTKYHEHHGFLWIRGNPGTGKSTLMKFILANAQRTMRDKLVISFFFNARGDDLEKSTIGLYRSLLLQLLERVPELQRHLEWLSWTIKSSYQWSLELLEELFEEAIQHLGQRSVFCFIDALDECPESEIRRMISLFERLGEHALCTGTQFHICFSSRHYPYITVRKGLGIILEGHEGHGQDIISYVDSELRIGHAKIAEELRDELRKKAKGVFMWVALVVDILNQEYDGGQVYRLRQRLRDIPGDLHELFHDILTRDSHQQERLLLCIQWVLFSRTPLTPVQLYFAVLSGGDVDELSACHGEELTPDDFQRFLIRCSKGLVEITKGKSPTVQFIHESVRDFFLKANGYGMIWKTLQNNFLGQSHESLKQCCLRYLSMDEVLSVDLITDPKPRLTSTISLPFLEYATNQVLYHADMAQENAIDQTDFILAFQLVQWIKLNNLFEKYTIRKYPLDARVIYILAEKNMANLVKVHPDRLIYLEAGPERYGVPLFAALATGSHDALHAMLGVEIEKHPNSTALRSLYDQILQASTARGTFKRDFTHTQDKSILSCLAERGESLILEYLIEAGSMEGPKDSLGQVLVFAAKVRHVDIVQMLHEKYNAPVEELDSNGWTPLQYAARNGHKDIVTYLLSIADIDVDVKGLSLQTPLSLAAEQGHIGIVELLLATDKVDINSIDSNRQTAFYYAATRGHDSIVKVLLATDDIDTSIRNNGSITALSWATVGGHIEIVKLLLEKHPIDLNLLYHQNGETLLIMAVRWKYQGIVKMLLDTGRVDVNIKDKQGWPALHYAVEPTVGPYDEKSSDILDMLLCRPDIDVNTLNDKYQTPLIHACRRGIETAAKKLLAVPGIIVDARDSDGETALCHAIRRGYVPIVKLLVEMGKADTQAKDWHGRIPLSYAPAECVESMLEVLEP